MSNAPHAWAGSFGELVVLPRENLQRRLEAFVPDASPEQRRAWQQELAVLEREGAQVLQLHPPAERHGALLEYNLPREAGRRPDVVVLQNGRVVVVEFKETGRVRRADLDQVAAYARDLAQYHGACEGQQVTPLLVLCGAGAAAREIDGVQVVPADQLAAHLVSLGRASSGGMLSLDEFLAGEYAPMPSLVAAARLLFQNLPLPFVRRARSAGVHDAVECVLALAAQARTTHSHKLVLLTGVPGAGKTLVGLQVAHSASLEQGTPAPGRRRRGAPATFLSGNGPLVQVLQHALKSSAFVQDMHRYIREYGLEHPDRTPPEHLVVFDEAQRAWDRDKLEEFYTRKLPHLSTDFRRSEPDLLVEISDRVEDWSLVLALVGEGQEIHTGEEGGLTQWAEAVRRSPRRWDVHGPASLAPIFTGLPFQTAPQLNLDTSLRAQAAGDLHRWVALVLDDAALDTAAPIARRLRLMGFPIYATRDLEGARAYVRDRFTGESDRRYGLLGSSKARNLADYGLATDFQATKRLKIGPWFNDGPESALSCCRLETPVTEFQCQGLELDLPIMCWADDLFWDGGGWAMRPTRRAQPLVRDPRRLRLNAYRVLLTRGREGLVLFVPHAPQKEMDATFAALIRAGAQPVEGRRLVQAA